MTKRLLISVFALALGISACNEGTMPTDPEQLNNPARELGASTFGQALASSDDATDSILDPVPAVDPSTDSTAGSEHIKDEFNRSKFKPKGYEHIKRGNPNASKYKPEGWEHRGATTFPKVDRTKYIPPGYKHLESGANETRYHKPVVVGDVDPVEEEPVDGTTTGSDIVSP